jgi:hypothetical protein
MRRVFTLTVWTFKPAAYVVLIVVSEKQAMLSV